MRPVLLFATVVLMGLFSQNASAQQLLGSIEGSVTDPSGAAIAKIEVKARNLDTNLEQSTTTRPLFLGVILIVLMTSRPAGLFGQNRVEVV